MRIELCYNITVAGVLEFFGVFEMEGQSEMYGRGLQKHKKNIIRAKQRKTCPKSAQSVQKRYKVVTEHIGGREECSSA